MLESERQDVETRIRAAEDYDPANRVVQMVPWRGDRAVRAWPRWLAAGGSWPWSESQGNWKSVA